MRIPDILLGLRKVFGENPIVLEDVWNESHADIFGAIDYANSELVGRDFDALTCGPEYPVVQDLWDGMPGAGVRKITSSGIGFVYLNGPIRAWDLLAHLGDNAVSSSFEELFDSALTFDEVEIFIGAVEQCEILWKEEAREELKNLRVMRNGLITLRNQMGSPFRRSHQ